MYSGLHYDMADSTEFEKRKEEEYEMQLLGFHSRAVNATLKSIVNETIELKCKKLCKTLQDKYDSNPEKVKELKENEKQLIQLYSTRAMPHLNIIENMVKKFISIPKNVLLKEDTCQQIQYTDEEFQQLQGHLKDLQHRLKKATILNAALSEELSVIERLQDYTARNNTMCDIIEESSSSQYTNSNMLKLVERYKELEKKLSHLRTKTQKEKYNPFENFEDKICDFQNM